MGTEKQKEKAKNYMKVYLNNPVRRELHNAFSSRWYHVTVKGNPAKLKKHRANCAKAIKVYISKNKLAFAMYQDFNRLLMLEEYPSYDTMYDTLKRISGEYEK